MEAIAKLNNCPTSPRKMRLVLDSIRGLNVENAFKVLSFTNREAAPRVEKLLYSAISNWKQANNDRSVDNSNLMIKAIFANQGPTIKRFRPAPQGRANRIRKRSNHVTIILEEKAENQPNQ